jgi:hypothetical protein
MPSKNSDLDIRPKINSQNRPGPADVQIMLNRQHRLSRSVILPPLGGLLEADMGHVFITDIARTQLSLQPTLSRGGDNAAAAVDPEASDLSASALFGVPYHYGGIRTAMITITHRATPISMTSISFRRICNCLGSRPAICVARQGLYQGPCPISIRIL